MTGLAAPRDVYWVEIFVKATVMSLVAWAYSRIYSSRLTMEFTLKKTMRREIEWDFFIP